MEASHLGALYRQTYGLMMAVQVEALQEVVVQAAAVQYPQMA